MAGEIAQIQKLSGHRKDVSRRNTSRSIDQNEGENELTSLVVHRNSVSSGRDIENFDFEKRMIEEWEESEVVEPTDPYRVLDAGETDSFQKIQMLYNRRMRLLNNANGSFAKLLKLRLEMAYAVLSNPQRRINFDELRQHRIARGEWARIQYNNGVYEGIVTKSSKNQAGFEREGKGTTILLEGQKYEGFYWNDVRHGLGLQMWGSGDAYVGQWSMGRMHGHGGYYYHTGSSYAGRFQNGLMHGEGRLIEQNGSTYFGQFVDGVRSGEGWLQVYDGKDQVASYDGEWKDHRKHGEGTYQTATEGSYSGQFVEGKFHGQGELTLPNGETYSGSFVGGKPHGRGKYCWDKESVVYEGSLRYGHLWGKGVMTLGSEGGQYKGQWVSGKPYGSGKAECETIYTGQWEAGLRHGEGKVEWESGCHFEGQFVNNLPHGSGMLRWPDGVEWTGTMHQGLRHGMANFVVPISAQRRNKKLGTLGLEESQQRSSRASSKALVRTHKERWHYGVLRERDGDPTMAVDPPVNDLKMMLQDVEESEGEDDPVVVTDT